MHLPGRGRVSPKTTVQPLPTLSAAELVVLEIAESFESAWFTVGAWAEESEHFGIGVELFNKALVRLIEELEFVEADMSSSPTRFRVVRDGEGDKKTRPFEEECPGCEVCNGKTYPAHPDAIPAGELTW